MNNYKLPTVIRLRRLRGFSMVELMVAMGVSVFLLAGLFSIMQSTRNTSDNERVLSQLQDNERVAMTLLTGVVESAGYYSNAVTNAQSLMLPADATFAMAGQAVVGDTNAQGDVLTLRYQADPADGVLNCLGAVDSIAPHKNQFYVNASGQFVCRVDGNAEVPLITLFSDATFLATVTPVMEVRYGVGSALADPNAAGSVDAYLTAAQMKANPIFWTNVFTVKIKIKFENPLRKQPGQTNSTVSFTRVISIKSRTGINVSSYT